MKKMNKKIIYIVFAFVLILIFLIVHYSYANIEENAIYTNQTVDNLEFSDVSFSDNKLVVVVTNTLDSIYYLDTITVSFNDKDGNVIDSIDGYIGNKIKANGKKQLVVSTDVSLENAYSLNYKINKSSK